MRGDGTFKKLHILQSRVVHSTTNLTLFRFITLFCETVSILQNISHVQYERGEYSIQNIVSPTKQCYGFE